MGIHAKTQHPLPVELTSRGGSPDLVAAELLGFITDAIANQPRSLQKRIGPSELGHPCARRIGYKLLGTDDINTGDVPWLPYIGTCVHAGLESVFDQANVKLAGSIAHQERFYVEHKVTACHVGDDIDGSCDLYDRVTATVVDWKIVGATTLRKYRANGPGDQYRTQAHLYGRGWRAAGHPVDTVMIAFLPRNEPLRAKAYFWHEPYDEQVALAAEQRANGIKLAVDAIGTAALTQLGTADAYCDRCPFYRANSTDLATGCPGAENRATHTAAHPFGDLVAS